MRQTITSLFVYGLMVMLALPNVNGMFCLCRGCVGTSLKFTYDCHPRLNKICQGFCAFTLPFCEPSNTETKLNMEFLKSSGDSSSDWNKDLSGNSNGDSSSSWSCDSSAGSSGDSSVCSSGDSSVGSSVDSSIYWNGDSSDDSSGESNSYKNYDLNGDSSSYSSGETIEVHIEY